MEYLRKPEWLKIKLNTNKNFNFLKKLVQEDRLNTVCEEARCPNIHECWGNDRTATFMILGDTCTRRCRFCAVKTGLPRIFDELEPIRIGEAVKKLQLAHVVITMVNRDELVDGGATIVAHTVRAIRERYPSCTIELLTSDFMGKESSIKTVLESNPNVMSHNLETVERLTPFVRSRSSYTRSLKVLKFFANFSQDILIKSSMMIGLGETREEILYSLSDLRNHGVQIVNLGQYLQPTKQHLAVRKYWSPEEFSNLKQEALNLGFMHCEATPLVRSSYHAGLNYEQIRRKIHPLYRNSISQNLSTENVFSENTSKSIPHSYPKTRGL